MTARYKVTVTVDVEDEGALIAWSKDNFVKFKGPRTRAELPPEDINGAEHDDVLAAEDITIGYAVHDAILHRDHPTKVVIMLDEPVSESAPTNHNAPDANRAKASVASALRELSANLMRVTRGAGAPFEAVLQAAKFVRACNDYREATGTLPPGHEISDALSLRVEDHRSKLDHALGAVVEGALRLAAADLLGVRLQASHGRNDILAGIRMLEREREEIAKSVRPGKR